MIQTDGTGISVLIQNKNPKDRFKKKAVFITQNKHLLSVDKCLYIYDIDKDYFESSIYNHMLEISKIIKAYQNTKEVWYFGNGLLAMSSIKNFTAALPMILFSFLQKTPK